MSPCTGEKCKQCRYDKEYAADGVTACSTRRLVRHRARRHALLHRVAALRIRPWRLGQPRLAPIAQPPLAVPVTALVPPIVGLVRLTTRLRDARVEA